MNQVFAEWCARWRIPAEAVTELRRRYVLEAVVDQLSKDDPKNSESYVQSEIRLEAPRAGCMLFRNNVGALLDERGVPVRYGLANDSKQLNERLKSADLIGFRRVRITQAMVGHDIAQFLSREVKRRDWTWSGTPRELAQMEWCNLVNSWGGDARMVAAVGSL